MIGTPIAFGLTVIVCFTLFYYYWRIRQLRARLVAAQNILAPTDFPVEFGIGKNIVETFPTIKACELKCSASEDLQCPICLVEYEDWEVLRQLPFCHHIFHTVCVGAWFEKQTTCPVCRMSMSELTASFGELLAAENRDSQRRGSPSSDVSLEVISNNSPPLTTESTRSYISSSRNGTEVPKTVTEQVQLETLQRNGDFHVISISQEERRHICRCSTKPIKFFPSDDPTAIPASHHQSVVQILVQIQESIQPKGRESNEDVPCLNSQETIAFATTQPVVSEAGGAVTNSKHVPEDSRRHVRVPL